MAVKSSPAQPVARQPRTPRQKPPVGGPQRKNARWPQEVAGLFVILGGLVLLVCLIHTRGNGWVADLLVRGSRSAVGIGAYALALSLVAIGGRVIRGRRTKAVPSLLVPFALLYWFFLALWHLSHTSPLHQFANVASHAGWAGALLGGALRGMFNDPAGYVVLAFGSLMVAVWALDMSVTHFLGRAVAGGKRMSAPVAEGARAAHRTAERILADHKASRIEAANERSTARQQEFLAGPTVPSAATDSEADTVVAPPATVATLPVAPPSAIPVPVAPARPKSEPVLVERKTFLGSAAAAPTVAPAPKPVLSQPIPLAPDAALPQTSQEPLAIPGSLGDDGSGKVFTLPPLTLLNKSPPPPPKQEMESLENQAILMQTLNDFKIGANVAQVAMGPTVTRYEVQLEPGILVKKIVSLADNLAMSLAAIDVRVEAPIPGKSAIGIEVPNAVTQMVSLRECLATNEFMNAPSKLTFALGKDVSGQFKYADLTRMPHLLVGGSTNSGKSVCLNVIISSILYRATPREVKFVMIDPKRVELSLYDGIPHLLSPVIKDVKQAAGILRSVLKEMEGRYDLFARIGTRNIEGYNNRVGPNERLPFIVVVVDELADLMMQQGAEVETSICRLAQLARATGIHLVIATQRPSVDVITGTIKANISSRIAFAVATQVDSRTIIDMPGADRLIGKGDMLFMPIDAAKPVRVQGCYIGERETEALVNYLKDQEDAVYSLVASETSASGMDGFEDDGSSDELFEPCVRWLVMQGQCSTSSLQRKFKIGYTRAARLVEVMEARSIVGSQDGVKPREILLRPENVDVFFAGSGQGDLGQG